MARKSLVFLFLVLAVVLLVSSLLVACETAGTPQPTATTKPVTSKPVTSPAAPTPGEEYPTPLGGGTELTPYP